MLYLSLMPRSGRYANCRLHTYARGITIAPSLPASCLPQDGRKNTLYVYPLHLLYGPGIYLTSLSNLLRVTAMGLAAPRRAGGCWMPRGGCAPPGYPITPGTQQDLELTPYSCLMDAAYARGNAAALNKPWNRCLALPCAEFLPNAHA